MIKKIKDLTLEEVKAICDDNKCSKCPFFTFNGWFFCKIKSYLDESPEAKEFGVHEIEVDEDEKENQELKETLNKTRKMGLEIIEEKEQLSNELHKLKCYRNIELYKISKLKKALDVLKDKFEINGVEEYFDGGYVIDTKFYYVCINKEEYELLKEVLGDDR